ncbi:MAG TPA: histidine phosphatase family protein [Acidimicrobiales bacterium]|jgi:broad specificity phosphatase PhoE|nr:histidine phosphatase family protein [Acidimicrobiales bacterium]
MTLLLLLRHAESEWNAVGRWQGIADPPLSERGERQADQAAPRLATMGISAAVSSDLRRARDTAERLSQALALRRPIGTDPDLREYDLGQWSGLTRGEIEAGWPGEIALWRAGELVATPGGERRDHFVRRITGAIARVARTAAGDTVLVVTHGGVISAVARSLGTPQRFNHLSGLWVEASGEGWAWPADGRQPLVSLIGSISPPLDRGEGIEVADPEVMDTVGH